MSKRYTITAALPYTNGPIHIGHLAGVYVPADIFARYQRLKNNDVAFICGSDEHGVAISIKAKKKVLPLRLLSINTTRLSSNHLPILAFHSIIIRALLPLFITKQLPISSKNYMNKVIL